jgi:hypothetical protein
MCSLQIKNEVCPYDIPMQLVTMHVGVCPALSIVPLHPSEHVIVERGAVKETVLLSKLKFVIYMSPLTGLKAIPCGSVPTGMVPLTVFVVGSP